MIVLVNLIIVGAGDGDFATQLLLMLWFGDSASERDNSSSRRLCNPVYSKMSCSGK